MGIPARHEMEHRCGHRRTTRMRVTLRTMQGLVADGLIANVSGSGALLFSALPGVLSSRVLVQLPPRLVQPSGASSVQAEIVRIVPGGFAVEWENFSPPEVRWILRQLGFESPTPRNAISLRAEAPQR
jgi:PilZ domain